MFVGSKKKKIPFKVQVFERIKTILSELTLTLFLLHQIKLLRKLVIGKKCYSETFPLEHWILIFFVNHVVV